MEKEYKFVVLPVRKIVGFCPTYCYTLQKANEQKELLELVSGKKFKVIEL